MARNPVTALPALIGASTLVNVVVEQLRERSRLLAMLVAFGTRRTTLSGSGINTDLGDCVSGPWHAPPYASQRFTPP